MKAPTGSLLTIGFGATVAMWFAGYVGRLPALLLPSPVLLMLLLACLLAAGVFLGRHLDVGSLRAAGAGAITGVLNLLVLGSFLATETPGQVIPSAAIWIPGSVLLSAGLTLLGFLVGRRWFASDRPMTNWPGAFVWVTVAATMLLLAVGGIVTSAEAGMAVLDWPTSFGYNMFLYPFSKMTGGIFYEHAHRLFGALVGLTTVFMAILLSRTESRRWVRLLAWAAVVAVVVQGLLGGLRVTGSSLTLAMTHGVLAQLFFSTLVALGSINSARWKGDAQPTRRPGVQTDLVFSVLVVFTLVGQLVLGAAQRHFHQVLFLHIVSGVALVAPLVAHFGMRTWGANPEQPLLRRLGVLLTGLIGVQLLLGFGAYLVTRGADQGKIPAAWDLLVSTLHQWTGALLLAVAVSVLCWNLRLLKTVEKTLDGAPSPVC